MVPPRVPSPVFVLRTGLTKLIILEVADPGQVQGPGRVTGPLTIFAPYFVMGPEGSLEQS